MGHLITAQGLQPDPDKVKAIIGMPQPKDKEGVKRFLGIVQYLARYIPNLSKVECTTSDSVTVRCTVHLGI